MTAPIFTPGTVILADEIEAERDKRSEEIRRRFVAREALRVEQRESRKRFMSTVFRVCFYGITALGFVAWWMRSGVRP